MLYTDLFMKTLHCMLTCFRLFSICLHVGPILYCWWWPNKCSGWR